MRVVIFKSCRTDGIDLCFERIGVSYYMCTYEEYLPVFKKFDDAPCKLGYVIRDRKGKFRLEFGDLIENYILMSPDIFVYFDKGDVLTLEEWDFLENWFNDKLYAVDQIYSARQKYLLITNDEQRLVWEKEYK